MYNVFTVTVPPLYTVYTTDVRTLQQTLQLDFSDIRIFFEGKSEFAGDQRSSIMYTNRLKRGRSHARIPSIIVLFIVIPLMLAGSASAVAGSEADNQRSLEGRHRLELRFGYWDAGQSWHKTRVVGPAKVTTRVEDLLGAISYGYWVHDQLSTDITATALVVEAMSTTGVSGISESALVVTSLMFGIRLYPVSSTLTPLRPYVSAGVGPYLGIQSEKEINFGVVQNVKTLGTFGGYVGGGVDIQMGRHLMAGIQVGYNVMADFPEPIGLDRNYDGLAVSAGLSVLLGKGSER
jgi:outer membrane protein W